MALKHPAARRALGILWRRLRSLLALLLTAIVGSQLWIFMWAPMHGHALDASLGSLLLPICLVLGGRLPRRPACWLIRLPRRPARECGSPCPFAGRMRA